MMIREGIDKGKREERVRIKGIITFTTAIMMAIAIVLFAFISLASADAVERDFDEVGGVLTYEGKCPKEANDEIKSISVYEGEEIRFKNAAGDQVAVIVSGPYDGDGDKRSGCMDYYVKAGKPWDSSGMKTYFFKVVEEGTEPEIGCWFGVDDQSFSLKLEKDKVQEGESFHLSLKTNNKKQGMMKLTIDEGGYSIMNDDCQDIYEVLVNYTGRKFTSDPVEADGTPVQGIEYDKEEGNLAFYTSASELDMKESKYDIILEDAATEEKEEVDIEVEKIYLEVECDEGVLRGKDIIIKIESSFYDEKANVTIGNIFKDTLTLDDEGKKKVRIPTEGEDYGRYRITVEIYKMPDMQDTKYVTIKKCETNIEVLEEDSTVGDIVQIEGTSESGDVAIFLIDDVFKGEATITDDEFKWEWNTIGELDGYHEIEVFILSESAPFSFGDTVPDDWQREEGVDASASVFLLTPTFSMTVSNSIAKGDPVEISGTATGTDHVYIIIFNYKGKVMFPLCKNASAVPATRTLVDEGEWTETIYKLDSGEYAVIVLSEGKDGVTEAIKNGKWDTGGNCKTMEQRVAILLDEITTAGSDDLYELAYFTVRLSTVRLKVPETVEIGTAINVTVETNIKDDVAAFVSLLLNSRIIDETTAEVKSGSADASFDTNELQPGEYAVTASIKGEVYDEKTVILVAGKEEVVEEEESEEGKESILQNEAVTEPEVEAIESAGEGEINESQEGEEIPVNAWDLLIAAIMAISISIAVRRRR
ncbi:MAG TPA: hypothetical protein EYP28_05040 [Methanophagales archaeon]|nr:hypothetical protein [Methanophagales archaeon]